MIPYNISFAGAGRVAGALCRKMCRSGIKILRIVSKSESDGVPLAEECNASWSNRLLFDPGNDVIIAAVPDNALGEILASIECSAETIVAHTAGSYGLEVFPRGIRKKGVFYPLQTFSKNRVTEISDIPFLLEASDLKTASILKDIATLMGGEVRFIDAERRKLIHAAAVFICNFTNYMFTAGSELSSKAELPFSIFEPLIRETVDKALKNGPEDSQTGPAIRDDSNTIRKHLDLLSFSPELQNIYRELTESIKRHYK